MSPHSSRTMRLSIPLATLALAIGLPPTRVHSQALAQAQAPVSVAVPGTEQFTLTSRRTGNDYVVHVWYPPGLDTMTVRPPVFLVTDGNLAFHTVHETVAMLAISGEVAPLIIVGVGYPQPDGRGYTPSYIGNRTRDYTPSSDRGMPGGGGSAAFLAFLKDELLPQVEARYRADPTRRGLGGHSLGGLFATYALLHEPGLFTRFWIGSPSLWWDKQLAFSWLPPARRATTRPVGRVYLTVGSDETDVMVPPMQRLASELRQGFPGLHVGSQIYANESHGSVVAGAISRALRFLYGSFGRPVVPVTPAVRAEYTGDWTGGGLTLRIRPSGAGMVLSFETSGQTMRDTLFAASRDTLFTSKGITSQFAAVRDAKGRITSLQGTLLGVTQQYVRAPNP